MSNTQKAKKQGKDRLRELSLNEVEIISGGSGVCAAGYVPVKNGTQTWCVRK